MLGAEAPPGTTNCTYLKQPDKQLPTTAPSFPRRPTTIPLSEQPKVEEITPFLETVDERGHQADGPEVGHSRGRLENAASVERYGDERGALFG